MGHNVRLAGGRRAAGQDTRREPTARTDIGLALGVLARRAVVFQLADPGIIRGHLLAREAVRDPFANDVSGDPRRTLAGDAAGSTAASSHAAWPAPHGVSWGQGPHLAPRQSANGAQSALVVLSAFAGRVRQVPPMPTRLPGP
jgi:hypothetical protein